MTIASHPPLDVDELRDEVQNLREQAEKTGQELHLLNERLKSALRSCEAAPPDDGEPRAEDGLD